MPWIQKPEHPHRSSHLRLLTHSHGNIQSHEQDAKRARHQQAMWRLSRIHPAWWKWCNACTAQDLCSGLGGWSAPEESHQGIKIPLYKGKGSTSDCCNYRGITLLSMPGKVFAHVILSRIRPTLLSYRHPQQSGFTPGRSTCDCIVTVNNIA